MIGHGVHLLRRLIGNVSPCFPIPLDPNPQTAENQPQPRTLGMAEQQDVATLGP